MTTNYKVPEDVKESLQLLFSLRHELPDIVTEPIEELVAVYRDEMQYWKSSGSEPEWDYYRHEINHLCHEADMPPLCEMG
jgi:hypothetical protein